ncbi:hypothetical protein KIW84_055326 [Lathyrus oleraceus]|uniref:Nucleoside diphosphate kinase-like domain-containing protein n=1 Tax=Pisum sativum TaxID=3888 RepID=A0A9D4X037_PEA|nr:hypothetical protein KIW84_055326 [Pisum sativum]
MTTPQQPRNLLCFSPSTTFIVLTRDHNNHSRPNSHANKPNNNTRQPTPSGRRGDNHHTVITHPAFPHCDHRSSSHDTNGYCRLGLVSASACTLERLDRDFAIDIGRNVIHGSDAVESANKEIALWFPKGAANWQSSLHSWSFG